MSPNASQSEQERQKRAFLEKMIEIQRKQNSASKPVPLPKPLTQ